MSDTSHDIQENAPSSDGGAGASRPGVDAIVSAAMMLMGAFLIVDGFFKGLDLGERAMPGIAPVAFGLSLAVPSGIIFYRNFLRWFRSRDTSRVRVPEKEKLALSKRVYLPLLVVLSLIAYAALMPYLGYLLTTFLFAFGVLWLLEWRGVKGFLAALGVTGGVYLLFLLSLRVPLPEGFLG